VNEIRDKGEIGGWGGGVAESFKRKIWRGVRGGFNREQFVNVYPCYLKYQEGGGNQRAWGNIGNGARGLTF